MHGRPRDRLAPRPDFKIRNVQHPPKKKLINRMEKQKHTEVQGARSGWNMVNMVGSCWFSLKSNRTKATTSKQKNLKTPKSKPQNPKSKLQIRTLRELPLGGRGKIQNPKSKIQNATKNQNSNIQNQNSKITSQKLNGPYKTCFLDLVCVYSFLLIWFFYLYVVFSDYLCFLFFPIYCFC